MFCSVVLLSGAARAAVTVDGSKTYQVIEGFGVNANHRSWNNGELSPVLDALIDQAGMSLFRVVYDNADWETNNYGGDFTVLNRTYANSPEFQALWGMMAYLNQRGISNGMMLNFQGFGPTWMGGQSLASGYESQWAQMITSAVLYAKKTNHLQFTLLGPNNEPDIPGSGIGMNASQYVTALHNLALQLDAYGLSDIRLVGPDLSNSDTNWLPQIVNDSVVMGKVAHFGMHSYSGNGTGSANINSFIKRSAYPNLTFWMTEFNVWCQVCQTGGQGTNNWLYFRGAAEYLLGHLANNASAGLLWDAYDSPYLNNFNDGIHWTYWGLFAVTNINASPRTYTPRKNLYTLSQITKYVRPGAVRIDVSGATSTLSTLAFYSTNTGQVTLTGVNTATSAATLSGTLKSLPSVTSLQLYYTDQNNNLRDNGPVSVNNGVFTVAIPANCVYTLVAAGTPAVTVSANLTSPANGASYVAPATIAIQASASTSSGSITGVGFYSGSTKIGQSTTAPYAMTWNNVPAGSYTLTAIATNSTGIVGGSSPVNVVVEGAPILIQQPQSLVVMAGSAAAFTVSATGAAPMSYQWFFNGDEVVGATSPTLLIGNAQAANAGSYSVVVSNSVGTATSADATLTVNAPGACVAAPNGLIGWWPGDGNASDISGTNNGTLQGGATATNAGVVAQAFTFNGTNNYVQIPNSNALRPTNLTIEAWVRFSALDSPSLGGSPAGDQYLVFKQNTRSSDFEGFDLSKTRGTSGDVFRFLVTSSTGQGVEIRSATLVSTGTWYHVAAVRGTNFTQLYVNGQLERQATVSFAQDYGTLPIYFGTSGQTFWDHKLKGSIDEVSIYNRALSAADIAAIYNAGSGGKCKTGGAALAITGPPQSQTVAVGSYVALTVTASGTQPLNYQWLFNGASVAGATSSVLTLAHVQSANAGSYQAVVTNSTASATSAVAVLTVLLPPALSTQPQSLTNVVGSTATFAATASGSPPLNYQWRLNGLNLTNGTRISGAKTNNLSVTSVQAVDAGSYALIVSNAVGVVTSAVAVLTVTGPPVITLPPASQSVSAGSNASFSVTASGTAPLTYQWLFNGFGLADGGQFNGTSAATLSITSAQSNNTGSYSVVVANSAGAVTSAVATLTVNVPGSCFSAPSGIVGWWPGDGNANDIVGTNNGTLQGGATATGAGLISQAFTFNGTNNYVQIPDSAALRPTNLTIEGWVRFSSLDSAGLGGSPAGDQYLVFKQNTRSSDFEGIDLSKTRVSGGDVFRFLVSPAAGTPVEIRSSTLVSTGKWYHVAAVRGTNFTQIYVNGQLERQTNVTFAQSYGTLPLYFGSSGQSFWDHKFKGSMDEVSLYNRVLSPADIAAIYAAGASGKCKPAARALTIEAAGKSEAITLEGKVLVSSSRIATFSLLPDGNSKIALDASSNVSWRIDASTDLLYWTTLTNVPHTNGVFQYMDRDATNFPRRFYRAISVP